MAIIQFHKNRGVVTLNMCEVKHLNLIIPNKHGPEGKIVLKHNEASGAVEIEIHKGDLIIKDTDNPKEYNLFFAANDEDEIT